MPAMCAPTPDYPVDDVSLGGMTRWNARYRPDHEALICGDRTATYAELSVRANRLAHALAAQGVQCGERVAVYLPNCIEYVEIYVAAAKLGFVVTPVNYMLTEREVGYILDDSGASALIYGREKRSVVDALREPGASATIPDLLVDVGEGGSYESLLDAGRDDEPKQVAPTEPFFQGYTSGTTGSPKGCLQTQRAFVDHFKRSLYHFDHRDDAVMLIGGPLFHEAPALFTLAQLFYGGTVVILPSFTPNAAMQAIQDHRCTMMGFAVPTMLDAMNMLGEYDVSSLRQIVCGGAALRAPTITATLDRFRNADLFEFYGATELGLMTTINHRGATKPGSVGRPFPGIGLAVVGEDGERLSTGRRGQIYITPIMMEGYYNRPEKTAEDSLQIDGVSWFTVGDVGYLDDDGYLFIVDRKKHMIITGGENVYPTEVEAVLIEHPGITDVAVIGLPDEKWGEAVTAVVVAAPGAEPSRADLQEFSVGRLAAFKIPKRVITVDALPRTPSGKVLKHVLRADHQR